MTDDSKFARQIAKLPTEQLEAWLESLGPNDYEDIAVLENELEIRKFEQGE